MVTCANRTGQRVVADVQIHAEGKGFRWHATLQDSGDPPAQLMGQAKTIADIEAMVGQRVSRIAPVGEVIQIVRSGPPSIVPTR